MICVNQALEISKKVENDDKLLKWWRLSHQKLDALILYQAYLGKRYLHIGQSDIKWISNPEFREMISSNLKDNGFEVNDTGQNSLKVTW